MHPDDFGGTLIKFKVSMSLSAQIDSVDNIPIFMYAQPSRGFEKVDKLSTPFISDDLDEGSWVDQRVNEIVLRALRRKRRGKVGDFDAIIIDPNNFSAILIKYT